MFIGFASETNLIESCEIIHSLTIEPDRYDNIE